MNPQLDGSLLAVGATVLLLGLVSRSLRRLSIAEPLVFFAIGLLLGPATGLLDPSRWGSEGPIVEHVARITLAVGLMRVALALPAGYVQRAWRSLGVLLTAGMVCMWIASSALVHLILGLPPLEAALVGAVLTPTDPIAAATITTGDLAEENLSPEVRQLLASESGANDGLAYALVFLPLLLLTRPEGEALSRFGLHTLLLGTAGAVAIGAALGWGMGRLLVVAERSRTIERPSFLATTIALALTASAAAALVGSNGVLAVFAAGIAFDSVVEGSERAEEESVVEAVDRFFTLPVFLLLGLVVPWRDWLALGWKAVAIVAAVLALRRLPWWLALRRAVPRMGARGDAGFLGWFGPIGVSAMYYGALARERTGLESPWVVGTLVVAASLVVHGLSAGPLTRAYGRITGARRGGSR